MSASTHIHWSLKLLSTMADTHFSITPCIGSTGDWYTMWNTLHKLNNHQMVQLPPSYLNSTGFQSIIYTSLLSELHWLPVNKRINFKIATLAYQSLAFGQPTYLSLVLTAHPPLQSLRSVNQNLLFVPRCNSSFGQRSFSYCAPKIWNDSPRHSTALNTT